MTVILIVSCDYVNPVVGPCMVGFKGPPITGVPRDLDHVPSRLVNDALSEELSDMAVAEGFQYINDLDEHRCPDHRR